MTTKTTFLYQKFKLITVTHLRKITTKPKFEINEEVEKLIQEEKIKPKKHPGIIKKIVVDLPNWLVKAIDQSLDDVNKSQLFKERLKFANYLFSRRLPMEQNELSKKYTEIESNFLNNFYGLDEEELMNKRKELKNQVNYKLKQKVFAWKSLEYNQYRSLLYLITRSAAEYSALYSIFNEIQIRDPEFDPRTVFDFGSGVGTVLWSALDKWKKINEYMGIDISNEMNDLSQNILKHRPGKFKGIFHRQYLPVSNLKFDLVVSAYSLMELPDAKNRLSVISKLWKKTNKYLVIIEQGSNAGFELVNEARSFVRHIMKNNTEFSYFTFAPCPHDMDCPRHIERKTPCNFLSRYMSLRILGPSSPKEELYSYVVLKKGNRQENDTWPRCVRKTIRRSKHAWCNLCTSDGNVEQIAFTSTKHGKLIYSCVKASQWGDRIPLLTNSSLGTIKKTHNDIAKDELTLESENKEPSFETEKKTNN